MRLEIKKENYNKFLKRKEMEVYIEHPEEATPSTAALQQLIAKQANADPGKTEIKEIFSSMGSPTSKGLVFIWDEKIVQKDAKASVSSDLSKQEEKAEEAPKE